MYECTNHTVPLVITVYIYLKPDSIERFISNFHYLLKSWKLLFIWTLSADTLFV